MISKQTSHNENSSSQPVAYSYIRWSTAIQEHGDSLRRQKQKAQGWSQKNGIPLADDRIMLDAGVSAYRGKNVKDGALGAFLKSAQEGKISKGSFLLVESIDRLSRQGMFKTAGIVQEIWEAGITIVTLSDEKAYPPDCDDMDALMIVLVAMRAKEESATKGRRVKDSWVGRYQSFKETGQVPTGNLLSWLTKDPATGKVMLDEGREPIVRQMVDMGMYSGLPDIAKTLNKRGIISWASGKRKDRSTYWTVSAIENILKNPALYGEYQPRKDGPVYAVPPVITKEEFFRLQAAKDKRKKKGRGRKGKAYTNLFSGIAKCSECGEPMTIRQQSRGRQHQFVCKAQKVKAKCTSRPMLYPVFERAFLAYANEIDLKAIIHGGTESRSDVITSELQTLEGIKQDLDKQIFNTMDSLGRATGSAKAIYEKRIDEYAAELDTVNERMKALESERQEISRTNDAVKESNLVSFPTDVSPDELYELRAKAAQHIRTIVDRIDCRRDAVTGNMAGFRVYFAGGHERTVFVNLKNPRKPFAFSDMQTSPDEFMKELSPA